MSRRSRLGTRGCGGGHTSESHGRGLRRQRSSKLFMYPGCSSHGAHVGAHLVRVRIRAKVRARARVRVRVRVRARARVRATVRGQWR